MTTIERFIQYVRENPNSTESFKDISLKLDVSYEFLTKVIHMAAKSGKLRQTKPKLKNRIKLK